MAQQSAEDIGKNLRAIRQLRGLSMSALAAASSVSKAMISKIERGDGGVSATTLGKLAEALEVGISDLLSKDDINSIIYLPADAQPVLHDSARGFVRRALSPIFPGRGVDVVHNELGPGGRTGPFLPHKKGIHEYIFVLAGQLSVHLNDRKITMKTGDSLFFDADCTHEMANDTTEAVSWLLVIDGTKYVKSIT
ncbi:XRE family transcriptional regulator [Tistrella mobilis]|uniref:helix-turn-helix domain-containing protein n=1 Tax=Tistrella mobilis TaxID=171437 RepID=UPI003556D8D0